MGNIIQYNNISHVFYNWGEIFSQKKNKKSAFHFYREKFMICDGKIQG